MPRILDDVLASTRPKATDTAELAGNEDVAVGSRTEASTRGMIQPFNLAQPSDSGRAAPNADRIPDRFGRRTAHGPPRDVHDRPFPGIRNGLRLCES
jgi:hypothetical protein